MPVMTSDNSKSVENGVHEARDVFVEGGYDVEGQAGSGSST